jgi:Uncharacterized protein conserved in bacteria (DUF2188)
MTRTERHVVPNPSGGWDIEAPGGSRASAHFDQQEQAISRARDILQNEGGGELVVHGRDGEVREKDTVAPGRDPNPPRDKT